MTLQVFRGNLHIHFVSLRRQVAQVDDLVVAVDRLPVHVQLPLLLTQVQQVVDANLIFGLLSALAVQPSLIHTHSIKINIKFSHHSLEF